MNKYLELLHKKGIPINVRTLCIGFSLGDISFQSFKNYELLKYLYENETQKIIKLNLCEARDDIDLKNTILMTLSNVNEQELIPEKEKWLFAKLSLLRTRENNTERLLYKIAKIYADFEYPESMKNFIHYMPSETDLPVITIQQAQNRLVDLCDVFLEKLQKKLESL